MALIIKANFHYPTLRKLIFSRSGRGSRNAFKQKSETSIPIFGDSNVSYHIMKNLKIVFERVEDSNKLNTKFKDEETKAFRSMKIPQMKGNNDSYTSEKRIFALSRSRRRKKGNN